MTSTEDNRFHWLHPQYGLITVYYLQRVCEVRARIILEASKETMDRIVDVFGYRPNDPLRIRDLQQLPAHGNGTFRFGSATVSQDLQAQGMAFSDEECC